MMNKKPKKNIVYIIAAIVILILLFCYLLFDTTALYDVDVSNFYNLTTELNRPITVTEVARALDNLNDQDPGDGSEMPGATLPEKEIPDNEDVTDDEIQADVDKGLYTWEDYNYLVALGGEASDYEGFYAVACCVRNRVTAASSSYKAVVTKSGAFSGYNSSEIGKPRNDDVRNAAIAVLRGGPSTVSGYAFFFGRTNGQDIWYESSKVGSDLPIVVGTGDYRNVFYKSWGTVHNSVSTKTADAVTIYSNSENKWYVN